MRPPPPTKSAHATRLPPRTTLHVGFAGKLYPAWIERWTRFVFTAAGPVGKSAAVVVSLEQRGMSNPQRELIAKLTRWDYRDIRITHTEEPIS